MVTNPRKHKRIKINHAMARIKELQRAAQGLKVLVDEAVRDDDFDINKLEVALAETSFVWSLVEKR